MLLLPTCCPDGANKLHRVALCLTLSAALCSPAANALHLAGSSLRYDMPSRFSASQRAGSPLRSDLLYALCPMLYAFLVSASDIHFNPLVTVGEFPGGVEGKAGDSL